MKHVYPFLLIFFSIQSYKGFSQVSADTLLTNASITDCIQYAVKHQPAVQQSLINEKITDESIRVKLADWYPQLFFSYSLQNNPQLPTAYSAGTFINTGTYNTSGFNFGLTQNIFNKDLLLANRTAKDVRKQAAQQTVNSKINTVAEVSKAFYDVLLTQKEMDVIDEDIVRLERSLKDAYSQYEGGVVDKTDYKRATISLNNAKAQRKQTGDGLIARYTYLKELMGYPQESSLQLQYDTANIEKDAEIDTTAAVNYNTRIEYQLLATQKSLYEANVKYYKWSYLPTLSAFGNYNLDYLNNSFSKLYQQSFPASNIGLTVAVPIFQGGKRVYQVKQAQQQVQLIDWDIAALKSNINTEYQNALSAYKGNLANYLALKDNVQLANDVYNVIRLQYQQGIKTYLDVIIAESDLRTSQLNYYTALYQLLQSKIDVQKALGQINY